jgi:hypothetical protein
MMRVLLDTSLKQKSKWEAVGENSIKQRRLKIRRLGD